MTGWIWRFLLVGLAAIAAGTALGQTPTLLVEAHRPQTPKLSRTDWINVRRIEDYLNNIKTARVRFRTVISTGSAAGAVEGDFYFWRPGRIRVECDPPVPILVVSDGSDLIYYNRQLGHVTYQPLSSDPLLASLLSSDNIPLRSGDFLIGFEQLQNELRLALHARADPRAGSTTLVFDPSPIRLKKWSSTDDQGRVIEVSLTWAEFNIQLAEDLFNIQFVLDQFRTDWSR